MKEYLIKAFGISIAAIMMAGCGATTEESIQDSSVSEVQSVEQKTDVSNPEPTIEIGISSDGYKAKILSEAEYIESASVLLSNMGKYENNYWKSLSSVGGSVDFDDVVSSAKEWLKENAEISESKLEEDYKQIITNHSEIISIEPNDTAVTAISSDYENLYNGYRALYQLVTSPSGSRSDFIDNFNEYSDTIKTSLNSIKILAS